MGKEQDRLPTDENLECRLARFCIDQTSFCALRLDQEGYILYANSSACKFLGYSQEELLIMSVFDIDPFMDRVRWPKVWETLCSDGSAVFESRHLRKDGTIFPVEVTVTLIEFNDNRYSMAFFSDITERKRVFESSRITQFIFDKAPLGIFLIRDGGDITNVNDHACQYLGYTREELCRMNVFDFDRGHSPQEIDQIWQRQKHNPDIDTFETVHRRKDGTDIPVEITGIRLMFDNIPYSVSFVKDISERKEAEKKRNKMEAQMNQAQKMESLGTLAGGIAHDFNNILGAILGYAELSQLDCPADSKLRNNVNQIIKAGHRAKELVQQILLFSRQDRSEKKLMDVSRVIEDALKLIKVSLPPNIEILANISGNLFPVFTNEIQIHQIVMNLCTNAYYAMKSAGGTLNVDLTSVTIQEPDVKSFPEMNPGQYIKLTVADKGCGIPKEMVERIFDPYFTTKPTGEGTGLGLSTIHGIIKDHGGNIKVYSEVGIGTTFNVFLPTADAAVGTTFAGTEQLPTGNGRILFVDDEKSLLEIGHDLLERLGYQVETRASSIDAFEAFRSDPNKYDLIISDMIMPEMTGDQMARQIRVIRSDIPIILCSGFSERINTHTIEALGISAVLMKPLIYADLAYTIHRVLKIDS